MRPLPMLLAATFVAGCHSQSQKAVPDASSADGFLSTATLSGERVGISTATLDSERVARVLPTHASEDARHLLRYAPPPAAGAGPTASFYANPRFDWTLPLHPHRPLRQQQVRQVIDQAWCAAHDQPQVYGRSARSGRWTYAQAGGGADTVFTELALSWKLYDNSALEPHAYSVTALHRLQQATAALAPRLAAQVGQASRPVSQAAQLSADLRQLVTTHERPAVIVLQADQPLAGRAVWDALLSLGLRWGDGDLFHWDNPDPDMGGDYLFDVATSTNPGYFLPEQLAAGQMKPADLVFSCSLPRSAAPEQVLASMHRAAAYCQRRLGGRLLTGAGQPFDLAAEQQRCRAVRAALQRWQLRPGQDDALYLF